MIASVPRTRELANSARNNGDKSRGEWPERSPFRSGLRPSLVRWTPEDSFYSGLVI